MDYTFTLLGLVYFLTTATTFTSLGVVLPGMLQRAELELDRCRFPDSPCSG